MSDGIKTNVDLNAAQTGAVTQVAPEGSTDYAKYYGGGILDRSPTESEASARAAQVEADDAEYRSRYGAYPRTAPKPAGQ